MELREQFLREYRAQALDCLTLPEGLIAQYSPVSCLKDGERRVYLVQDQAGWLAVLKIQPAGREDTLRQEYDLLRELRHPQIPRPLTYLEADGLEYLVREYVEGISLYEWVTARGPLAPEQVRATAISMCQVLQDLHSHNPPVICRDVKPQNVVLDPAGRCHLIDLGAARRYRPNQTGDTVFLGTEATAPPEQFGYQQTDQRSDIYSLGVLLRFLLTGSFAPAACPKGPRFLLRAIRRCTAFDPKDRYPSVQAVLLALRMRPAYILAGAAVLLCAAALTAALWNPPGSTEGASLPQADGLTQAASVSQTDSAQVTGTSDLLAAALRRELGLKAGEPVPAERLGEVEQLLVCGQLLADTLPAHEATRGANHDPNWRNLDDGDICSGDLEILAQCPNLRVLILDYQQITDLSPLAGLPLEYLSLTGNQITDLTPLAGCQSLRVLDLGENPVRSADVLSQLPALREVNLDATGITSVEVLAGTAIEWLSIRDTWITDYTPLENCPSLAHLIVGQLPGGAVETLTGLTNLKELRLYSTLDVDLSQFTGFQRLQDLDLYGCTLAHPEALTQLASLRFLNLGETGLSDLSFLPDLPALTEVDLREDLLSDLSPLLECPWLTLLTLSPRHQSLAQEQLSQASFQIQYQSQ